MSQNLKKKIPCLNMEITTGKINAIDESKNCILHITMYLNVVR